MKKQCGMAWIVVALLTFSACGRHEKPSFTFMPDMADSPAVKAQEQGSMMKPVAGTIPRDFQPRQYVNEPEKAGLMLKNPLPRTKENFAKGKEFYNIYCMVCHGQYGEGDGPIVPKFPRPPSLQSDKVRGFPDGRLFHIITNGQNLMPSYASQIETDERWAVVHYVRALQRAKNPSAQDLKAAETW